MSPCREKSPHALAASTCGTRSPVGPSAVTGLARQAGAGLGSQTHGVLRRFAEVLSAGPQTSPQQNPCHAGAGHARQGGKTQGPLPSWGAQAPCLQVMAPADANGQERDL